MPRHVPASASEPGSFFLTFQSRLEAWDRLKRGWSAAFDVCSGLKALASAKGDRKLSAQVDFSRSDLARGRENEVTNRGQSLFDLGTVNAAVLAEKYNVSANDLKALKTATADFVAAQPRPRQSTAASASATQELVVWFAKLDDVLGNQLDPLTQKFRETDPAYCNEYRTARAIVDNAASRKGKEAQPANVIPVTTTPTTGSNTGTGTPPPTPVPNVA